MPFKEQSIVMQREELCRLALQPGANLRELARRFGVSPQTVYDWVGRYRVAGRAGLEDRSRRPLSSPSRTSEAVTGEVLSVRAAHPAWGGRKIRKVLEMRGLADPPSASTITDILRRHGLLDGPGSGAQRRWTRFEYDEPNELWQMDFKGHFGLLEGRCHPLTVLDDHSRYALEIGACVDEQTETVRCRLEQVFSRYGLPRRILADNGAPWGSAGAPAPHTRLTVWLMDLGVGVIHGRPYHPQTQGKDERFHRSLKAEVLDGVTFRSPQAAQAAFDAWREVYNSQRPHEGIGMATPSSRYHMSQRAMPKTIAPTDYEPGAQVRSVDQDGHFSFKGRVFGCSRAFQGRRIALRPTDRDGVFDVCYRRHVLGQIDLAQDSAKNVHHVPEHPSTFSPV